MTTTDVAVEAVPYRTTTVDMGVTRVIEETAPGNFKTIANYATDDEARAFLEGVRYATEGPDELTGDTWDRAVSKIRAANGTGSPRKRTIFKLCAHHEWLAGERRERRAEFFAESGPTDRACDGVGCKIRPGTDLFTAELCEQQDWYGTKEGPFLWTVNGVAR